MTGLREWLLEKLAPDLMRRQCEAEHLRSIGAALAQDISLIDMAGLVAQECRSALEADATCVYILQPGGYYEMLGERGCTDEWKTEWKRVPREIIPLANLKNPQDALFLGSADEFREAIPLASPWVDKAGRKTVAYAPLVVNQQPLGILGFSYNRAISCPARRTYVQTIINFCAQALQRVRLMEKEQIARQQAEMANRAKSEFLADISHEIRTPIGVIQGFADLLLESEGLSKEQRHWTSVIRRNTQQLTGLLGEVLDISKIEADKIELDCVEFSLDEMLEDVRTLVSFKAEEKGIELEFDVEPMPELVFSDPVRLRQIFVNLIGNAIKFTEKGRVRVHMTFTPTAQLQVEVTDTGIGIPREVQGAIFEPFRQADATTARRFGGTGLGLTISKRLAQALGGDVVLVESTQGKGSTFLFMVPCEPITAIHPSRVKRASGKIAQGQAELKGLKILLVEDSHDNQDLIRSFLAKEGAQVDVADSGLDGVRKALSDDYNVVLMDIQMPGINGHEAVSWLRAQGYDRPIAALTAHVLSSERQKSLREGFDDYLTKPIDRPTLIRSLKRLAF